MQLALQAASKFLGNTSPNPAVGALALDKKGNLLAIACHQKAGSPHAESSLLQTCLRANTIDQIHSIYVTLEPCNHYGKTPPCTDALLSLPNLRKIFIGSMDPNPYVAGGGAKRLEENGIEVIRGVCQKECDALIRSFTKFVKTKTPYVTIKTAYQANGSMIPPSGKKTFTQESSLRIAHELRKRADAIWVASGTVLHDLPKLNVRNVPDFPSKKRYLILSDRRNRIPQQWIQEREEAGFQIFKPNSLREGLDFLTKNSCLEVLVEPGPTFLEAWRKESLWDEIVVVQRQSQGQQDKVKIQYND